MTERTFQTERLQLAVFLHASGLLRFVACEQSRPGKLHFVFDDPGNQGNEYELQFDNGATVSAVGLLASLKYMRRLMTQQQGILNSEKVNESYQRTAAAY